MDFKDTLTFRIARLSTVHRIEIERRLNEFGLHGGQVLVLFELWTDNGLSQVDLASRVGLTAATINRMAKSLATNRFVELRSCEHDGRLKRVFLTEKGVGVKELVEKCWAEMEQTMLSELTSTEKLILGELADKLTVNVVKRTVN